MTQTQLITTLLNNRELSVYTTSYYPIIIRAAYCKRAACEWHMSGN